MTPGVPRGYRFYTLPNHNRGYGVVAAPGYLIQGIERAQVVFAVLSGVAASFNGFSFGLRTLENQRAGLGDQIYTFYTGAPPAPPAIGIPVTAMTLPIQIAASIKIALGSLAPFWNIEQLTTTTFRVRQPSPGALGNTIVNMDLGLNGLMTVNGIGPATGEALFFNGQDLQIAALWGKQRAMLPGPSQTVQSEAVG